MYFKIPKLKYKAVLEGRGFKPSFSVNKKSNVFPLYFDLLQSGIKNQSAFLAVLFQTVAFVKHAGIDI
jgi:hypothetical protein